MAWPRLLCPDSRELIDRLSGHSLVVRVASLEAVANAAAMVEASGAQLFCVRCQEHQPLAALRCPEDLEGIPVALYLPELGPFREIVEWTQRLRDLEVRIYLPSTPDNLVALRLLSSLGVPSCATFDSVTPDWEALADLATYALLGRVPHAAIDPFETIADRYRPEGRTDWHTVHFADPSAYLHLDDDGRVALSHEEMLAGTFIADDVEALPEDLNACAPFVERTKAWRKFFLDDHFCASCNAWRLCQGSFAKSAETDRGCASFFGEFLSVIEESRAQLDDEQRGPEPWRP